MAAPKKDEPPPAPEFSMKMMLVPALMLGLRAMKLDLTAYVVLLRVAYALSTLLCNAAYVAVLLRARQSTSKETVDVVDKVPGGAQKRRTLSVGDYDAEEALKKIKTNAFAVCVVGFIHYKWGSPMPLLLQSIMQPINLTDDPLVNIYFFGKDADGKFKRPFKVANPLQDLIEGNANDGEAEVVEKDAAAKKKN